MPSAGGVAESVRGNSTSWVLVAGGIAAANEAIFVPAEDGEEPDFSSVWKILPATALLAVGLALLERVTPEFATGIAKLLVLGVLVFPVGTAGTPLQNAARLAEATGKAA